MDDKLCFVQFLHPGREHEPEEGGHKAWNTDNHRRKFVECPGRYLSAGIPKDAVLDFWAEWEPESTLVRTTSSSAPGAPRFVFSPYLVTPTSSVFLQNTDPFVFGEHFLYVICQQHRGDGRPTQMRNLTEGSVILFGSCQHEQFLLDTVFVVASYEDFTPEKGTALNTPLPLGYGAITLDRVRQHLSYRLYRGATFAQPLHGMYSFFPCRPAACCPDGFPRPTIQTPQFITDTLAQGRRLNPQNSIDDVSRQWQDVRDQVMRQQLDIGVYARMPAQYGHVGSSTPGLPGRDTGCRRDRP